MIGDEGRGEGGRRGEEGGGRGEGGRKGGMVLRSVTF